MMIANPQRKPELSIIVPVVNEARTIDRLLLNLAKQTEVKFEIILCDGSSTDGTADLFLELTQKLGLQSELINADRGRGRQLNSGVLAAHADILLFLHADSSFKDNRALRRGIDTLCSAMKVAGHERVAGHFALSFTMQSNDSPLFYYYHEQKARLDRHECTHGDQGFLVSASFFASTGGFDEQIPVLEDTRLAESIRGKGKWVLLPAEICTSSRRFESEGRTEREILNGLIMTIAEVRPEFLHEMKRIYASHGEMGRLRLSPFLHEIQELIKALPLWERILFWDKCGRYVASNLWQVAFLLDVVTSLNRGIPPGNGKNKWLDRFDCYLGRIQGTRVVEVAIALLVLIWFRGLVIYRGVREERAG